MIGQNLLERLWCVDIETGGLAIGSPIIEVAYGPVFGDGLTVLWNKDVRPEDCNPEALKINRCFEPNRVHVSQEEELFAFEMAHCIETDLKGKVLVAANPQFDDGHLAAFLRKWNRKPSWSYRLIDIKSLCVGYIAAGGGLGDMPEKGWGQQEVAAMFDLPPIPALLAHTAAGDVTQLRQLARMALMSQADKVRALAGSSLEL